MTSLFDRPITAASDDGVCRWHAVTDTREIIETTKIHIATDTRVLSGVSNQTQRTQQICECTNLRNVRNMTK